MNTLREDFHQDGRNFYDDATGELIFTSHVFVRDGDFEAANKAREEFLAYRANNLKVTLSAVELCALEAAAKFYVIDAERRGEYATASAMRMLANKLRGYRDGVTK